MNRVIGAELRRLVAGRAGYRCEYCLIGEDDTFFGCEVDHIISVKHGGATSAENLAYACVSCNRRKGSDLASILPETGILLRFFNPRVDAWKEHFRFDGGEIVALTMIGTVTARIFEFNSQERVLERRGLVAQGRYQTELNHD